MQTQIVLTPHVEFPEVAATTAKKLLVMANLKAPEMASENERAPVSVSAVIDQSGSMQGKKLHLVKSALKFVISNFTQSDEFGIIAYSRTVVEALPLTKMDAEGKRRAQQAVDKLRADGCTNLSGGLFAGIDQLKGLPFTGRECTPVPAPVTQQDTMAACSPGSPAVTLLVGNEAIISNTNASAPPQWTLFVRLADGVAGQVQEYVKQVSYHFSSECLTVAQAPFGLSRAAHPADQVKVEVQLIGKYGSSIHTFNHCPNLASPLTFSTHHIPLTQVTVPQITTTPPSAAKQPAKQLNDVAAVWLFTDGLANKGIQNREHLVKAMAKQLEDMLSPFTIFTFGFGSDHDAQLLSDIADAGKGMYYYIEQEANIVQSFADCLGGLLSVVARNIKVTITAQAGSTLCKLFTSFEHHVTPVEAWVRLPDLYDDEDRDLLFEVEVPAVETTSSAAAPIVAFQVDYHNQLEDKAVTIEAAATISRPEEARPAPPNLELDMQRNRVLCTAAIDRSKQLADMDRLQDARHQLEEAIAAIKATATSNAPYCQTLVEDLVDCLRTLEDQMSYEATGPHTMNSKAMLHGKQRSCGEAGPYTKRYKSAMMAKAKTMEYDL